MISLNIPSNKLCFFSTLGIFTGAYLSRHFPMKIFHTVSISDNWQSCHTSKQKLLWLTVYLKLVTTIKSLSKKLLKKGKSSPLHSKGAPCVAKIEHFFCVMFV